MLKVYVVLRPQIVSSVTPSGSVVEAVFVNQKDAEEFAEGWKNSEIVVAHLHGRTHP